nr:leucyl/phenylalanyl-tRNA--protein transferase [Brevundimonas aveniformis]
MGRSSDLTIEGLLGAYAIGVFPMAEGRDDPALFFVDPALRGIIPLEALTLPRRLGRTVRSDHFEVRVDTAFEAVLDACAAPGVGDRSDTWINPEIRRLYLELHAAGFAHSVECWREGHLAGGLYGVALGAAFFGESMVSFERDASKVALVHLIARLRIGGYRLLDAQFLTPHLTSLGAIEITRDDYQRRLRSAVELDADFGRMPYASDGASAWQETTQAS